MRQIICIIYILFLTNLFDCYQVDLDFSCGTKHITSTLFTYKYNVTLLEDIQMRSCEITAIDENAFDNMIKLKNIDLSNNQIEHLPANVFSSFLSLEQLSLKSNKIQNLDANLFKNLNELTLLDLHSNKINKIDKNLFKNLIKLKVLYLYSNKISVIEAGTFDNNLQLHYLDFYDNYMTEIKSGVFANLLNLDKLYISYNNIKNIASDAFPLNSNLTQVILSGNKLEYLDHEIISNLKKLQYLTLFANPWNCNYKLMKLINVCKNINLVMHPIHAYPSCTKPEKLANRKWNTLTDKDISSINIILEPKTSFSKGEVAMLGCHTTAGTYANPIKLKLSWLYDNNTDVVNTLEASDRPFIIQYLRGSPGVIWNNLTIQSLQECDAGVYKCVLHTNDSVIEEQTEELKIH